MRYSIEAELLTLNLNFSEKNNQIPVYSMIMLLIEILEAFGEIVSSSRQLTKVNNLQPSFTREDSGSERKEYFKICFV